MRLQKDAGDTAAYYKVDLVDLEMADAPYARPAHFISVTDFGAVANDGVDDRQAFINAVASAQATHQGLWIPAGSFTLSDRINLSGVQVRGAGMWHTVLQGVNGKGGFYAVGSNVTIADLSVVGDALSRRDGEDHAGFEGNFGTGSLIQNVWVEHTKVGVWPVGGTDGLFVVNGRIRDTWADGVNFWAGVQNTTMSQFNVRNTGDDAMAMCSCGGLDVNDSFRFNTVQVPVLANAFALYGGKDNKLLDNIGADTVSAAAGVAISTRREVQFAAVLGHHRGPPHHAEPHGRLGAELERQLRRAVDLCRPREHRCADRGRHAGHHRQQLRGRAGERRRDRVQPVAEPGEGAGRGDGRPALSKCQWHRQFQQGHGQRLEGGGAGQPGQCLRHREGRREQRLVATGRGGILNLKDAAVRACRTA